MVRTIGVGVVVAGLAGAVGCASTARPMVFQRNQPAPVSYPLDQGVVISEGPMLPQGVPIASMPGATAPMMAAPPGGMMMPPAAVAPTPTAPPPPVGPQPRTTPGSGTNTTNAAK